VKRHEEEEETRGQEKTEADVRRKK